MSDPEYFRGVRIQSQLPPNAPNRIAIIHYLRGLASLAVAWFHLTNQWSDAVRVSGSFGWLGIEVFFVISGFVIPYSISKTYEVYSFSAFSNFILRRVLRIEVPYILSIFVVVALGYLSSIAPGFRGPAPDYTVAQVASNLFYVAPFTGQNWLQPVYWTLSYEFAFYLTVGILFGVLFKKTDSRTFNLAVAILVLAVVCKIVSLLVLLFVLGAAVFRLGSGRDNRLMRVSSILVCGITIAYFGNLVIAIAGLATAAAIAFGKGFYVNGMPGRALTYLGTISYSLYLVHVPIGGRAVNLAARFTHSEFGHLIVSVLSLALSLVASHIFYVIVERPAVRKARQLVSWDAHRQEREFAC